jgi:hypothetical protein
MIAGATLAAQRCRNHPQREAAALCTSCRRPYCRECVADHQGRMLCAECLARQRSTVIPRRIRRGRARVLVARSAAAALGLLVAWLTFAAWGRVLHALPAQTHELSTGAIAP